MDELELRNIRLHSNKIPMYGVHSNRLSSYNYICVCLCVCKHASLNVCACNMDIYLVLLVYTFILNAFYCS